MPLKFESLAGHATVRIGILSLVLLNGLFTPPIGCSQEEPPASRDTRVAGQHWAVIIVGLPGDAAHAALFQGAATNWQNSLTRAGIAAERLMVLEKDGSNPKDQGVTRDRLAESFAALAGQIEAADSLWVFFLGHGNYDDGRPAFHVRGPDPDDAEIAGWLEDIHCQRQVVWLTHSCSGWFVKRLSAPSRIVIASTATDQEPNETEFPHALATVLAADPSTLDENADAQISVLELFAATVKETEQRFASNQRVPTEHAQLDDNGDGKGTELGAIKTKKPPVTDLPMSSTATPPVVSPPDGELANTTYLPLSVQVRSVP